METKLHTQPPCPLPGAPDTREIRTAHVPPIPHAPAGHPTARHSRLGRRAGPAPALPGTSVLCAAGGGLTPPLPPGSELRAPVTEQLLLAKLTASKYSTILEKFPLKRLSGAIDQVGHQKRNSARTFRSYFRHFSTVIRSAFEIIISKQLNSVTKKDFEDSHLLIKSNGHTKKIFDLLKQKLEDTITLN